MGVLIAGRHWHSASAEAGSRFPFLTDERVLNIPSNLRKAAKTSI